MEWRLVRARAWSFLVRVGTGDYRASVRVALAHGVDAVEQARVLVHRCDNPICQRVDDDHVRVSSAVQNRREWLSRRRELGPLADRRGPAARARMLRELARVDPSLVAADLAGLRGRLGEQLLLPLG